MPPVITARSLMGYGNSYDMNWFSHRVVTDIRNQLFAKIVGQSMDFFNRMRAGVLMSRITNDTSAMQAALSQVSSDAFKQPVSIVLVVAVLLYMDWKFTLVTLVLFPSVIVPIRIFGRRARQAVQNQQENMGQMVVTMQETFAGIRVVKSFGREAHQVKSFSRSTMLQFRNVMRMVKSMEVTGPLIEVLGAMGFGLALLYVYAANLSAGRFLALIGGIFPFLHPVKKLSKIQLFIQRSVAPTAGIFWILDTPSAIPDSPDAQSLHSYDGR